MPTLLVLKFDSVGGAAQMRDRMLALQKQQLITVEDAAIMWRDTDGKPKLTQLNDMAGVGALGGAFWGMLFGLLFFIPVIGLDPRHRSRSGRRDRGHRWQHERCGHR
jgi:uncharacterized membrane protein